MRASGISPIVTTSEMFCMDSCFTYSNCLPLISLWWLLSAPPSSIGSESTLPSSSSTWQYHHCIPMNLDLFAYYGIPKGRLMLKSMTAHATVPTCHAKVPWPPCDSPNMPCEGPWPLCDSLWPHETALMSPCDSPNVPCKGPPMWRSLIPMQQSQRAMQRSKTRE